MSDVSNSADLIAQYGFYNVDALGKAAVEAAKMGTSLTQMAKTAENLMDLDNARTNAMQLSVLLGRQINIDRAQQLIYAGDLEGGYKEMLNQLGGIQAFNQMDYYQKAEAAKLMGVSVGELQKQLNLQAGLTETGEKQSKWWAATLSTAQSFWGGMKENAETIMASVNMVGAMGQGLASFAPAVGGFGTKMKDAFKGSGIGKFLRHGKEAPKKKQESPKPDMKTPEKGVGDRLKDLAKGLREMGKNTFKGILALALAGPAMVLAVPAIPFLLFMGLTPLQMLQTNLQGLGKGLSKIGEKAFLGATILGVLGVSGAIMVAAIPALLFIAIMGVPLQIGLQALGKGLSSLGSAAMNPYTWLGVVLLGAIGVALIPFGVALMFAGAGMGLFAAGLAMMMAMVPPIRDLAGFCTGVVEESEIIDGKLIKEGDVVIGIESSGLHSNGYSLIRDMLFRHKISLGKSYINDGMPELLNPTTIYAPLVANLLEDFPILGMAHITGGGIPENLPRCIPDGLTAVVDYNSWKLPEMFSKIMLAGEIPEEDMKTTFNMGIGYCLVVPEEAATDIQLRIHGHGLQSWIIGEIVS